jgi:RimJ/RimL family protein N-acetyltransferase
MEINLRKFEKSDLKTYSKWREEINADQFMSRWFPWKFNENIIDQPEHYRWSIITCSGLDIGTVWIENEENIKESGRLGILIGNSNYWDKGIGKIAIQKAIENTKGKFKAIYLNVRRNNPRAISCYNKCGFFQINENHKIEEDGNKIEFITMKKEIN